MADSTLYALQAVTRFLLPFRFAEEKTQSVRQVLLENHWSEHVPNRNYLADFSADFLMRCFGVTSDHESTRSNLFQWNLEASKVQPGQEFNVAYKTDTERAMLWNQDGRDIELFLSDHGVGVLSITLSLAESRGTKTGRIPIDRIKSFNYSLSQDPSRKSLCALLTKSSGTSYEATSLKQLLRDMIAPIRSAEFHWNSLGETAQLIPYTVIRLPKEFSFTSLVPPPTVPRVDDVAAQASLLAQVGEALHPLPVQEDPGALVRIYHTDELFAVSSMGAAAVLVDTGTQYDHQKVQDRLDKYFVCFLTALSQRLRLRQLLQDASDLALLDPGTRRDRDLERLRSKMLATVSRSELIEVSTRDTVNRFFSQCQQAQHVPQSLALVQKTIADMDASLQAEKQSAIAIDQQKLSLEQTKLTRHMAATQTKVEWIETFLISFYAAELVDLLGRNFHLTSGYLSGCVLAAMIVGGVVAALLLRPWAADKTSGWPPPRSFSYAVAAIGVLLALFLVTGKKYFAEPVDELETLQRQWTDTQIQLREMTSALRTYQDSQLQGDKSVSSKVVPSKDLQGGAHAHKAKSK